MSWVRKVDVAEEDMKKRVLDASEDIHKST